MSTALALVSRSVAARIVLGDGVRADKADKEIRQLSSAVRGLLEEMTTEDVKKLAAHHGLVAIDVAVVQLASGADNKYASDT